jgi:hydrogenase large subunit
MLAIFGGKMPHDVAIVPGGVTQPVTVDKIAAFLWRLNDLRDFINYIFIPDVLAVAKAYSDYFEIGAGCGNLLAYGVFDLDGQEPDLLKRERFLKGGRVSRDLVLHDVEPEHITEQVRHAWYDDAITDRNPAEGDTVPRPGKDGAYSWLKAPRYDGQVYEVGPLARMVVAYARGDERVKTIVDSVLSRFDAPVQALFSVLGRHAARALECKLVADAMADWVLQLKPGEPVYAEYELPETAQGVGLVDGPRGALGHWIRIENGMIANYQCVVPSTWNLSPRDDRDQPGPVEQALIGTRVKDEANPFEVVRIVRSFDPCLACAVHVVDARGWERAGFRVP